MKHHGTGFLRTPCRESLLLDISRVWPETVNPLLSPSSGCLHPFHPARLAFRPRPQPRG